MTDINKKWVLSFLAVFVTLLLGVGALVIIIDPCFHFHKPLPNFDYPIIYERYQNDGIVKHFEYNAIITGTSMTENFMASDVDDFFDVQSVKVPFSGGSYKEVNDNLRVAVEHNSDIKMILRGLDYDMLLDTADEMRYEESSYPRYLYDDILSNDIYYVFNKAILFREMADAIAYNIRETESMDFDTYANWQDKWSYGKAVVDSKYKRAEKSAENVPITEEDYKNITENITQNVTSLVKENPEIEFYFFFTPYSIYYWDGLHQTGQMERYLEAEKYVIELLLQFDNIHLYSFFTEYDLICDLDYYRDEAHYNEQVNSQILLWIYEGKNELTQENYEEYCKQIRQFYMNYDYDSLFVQ